MSRDTWSILPQPGDMVAEVRTRRFRTLTYARATARPKTSPSSAASASATSRSTPRRRSWRAAAQFYNEDDLTEYDVLDYDIDVDVAPEREWLTGVAAMRLRVKAFQLGALNLKLAENYTISSITSKELGRLLFLRVRNQNGVVVNLPTPLSRDYELTLTVQYQGRHRAAVDRFRVDPGRTAPQRPGRPADRAGRAQLAAQQPRRTGIRSRASPTTPRRRCASRCRSSTPWRPRAWPRRRSRRCCAGARRAGQRFLYSFRTTHPVRYLGAVVSRMTRADAPRWPSTSSCPPPPPPPHSVTLAELMAPPKPPPVGSRNTVDLVDDGQPAAGEPRPRRAGDHRRHPALLRVAHGRCAVSRRSRWRCSKATCPAATARPTSPCSTTRCRPRRSCGATTRRRSATSPSSSSPTRSPTSGGARRWAGRTTTSSGSARGSRSTSPRSTPASAAATASTARRCATCGAGRWSTRTRGRSRSATGWATSRTSRGCSGRWSTTRARRCCTCCGG